METFRLKNSEWQKSSTEIFWAEIAPCNHIVQIYESEKVVIDSIEGFVNSGLNANESVIIIATEEHLSLLNARLTDNGFNIAELISTKQYIPLDAEETLAKFMVNGWPDEELFMNAVKEIVSQASQNNKRRVRAYGEMVALLWGQDNCGATIQLEHLWNEFCKTQDFCLFFAYPRIGFSQDVEKSISEIISTHTKVIAGWENDKAEVYFRNVQALKFG